jgi:glycosyltransferase involved in cell wall biosynthesis
MTAPLRVLYVVPQGERGGVERFLESVLAQHDRARVVPSVLAGTPGTWLDELRARGIAVHILDRPHLRTPWRHFGPVLRILREERVEVVHSAYSWCHALVAPSAAVARVPAIWFHHGPLSPGKWQGVAPLVPSPLLLANSHFLAGALRHTLHGARRLDVIHYGLEADRFAADAGRREAGRAQLGLADDEIAIGVIGFIDTWKGQDVFLRAAERLAARHARARFLVIGGPRGGVAAERCERFLVELRAYASRPALAGRVSFTGHVDLRAGALDALDVVVHASTDPEPFGMVLLEAMAAGKPVVASNAGGPVEIIRDGVDGVLVPPGDPALLADALERLITDAGCRSALGRAAVERVRAAFHPRHPAERLEAWYERLAPTRRRD